MIPPEEAAMTLGAEIDALLAAAVEPYGQDAQLRIVFVSCLLTCIAVSIGTRLGSYPKAITLFQLVARTVADEFHNPADSANEREH